MADLFTYIIYFSTLFISVVLIKRGYNYKSLSKNNRGEIVFIFLGFLVLVLIGGLRYNVGADYTSYTFLYVEQPFLDDSIGMEIEYGYIALVNFLNKLNLEAWSFFIISALITYFLLFYSFKNYKYLLYLGVFFYITYGFYFFSFNGVRQAIAMSALAVAVMYAQERKMPYFFGIIILGGLMHKSLFLFFPFYFIITKIKLNKYVWYGLFLISLLLHFIPLSNILNISSIFNILAESQLDYSNFSADVNADLNLAGSLTLGYLARVGVGLFILTFYTKLTRLNPNYLPYFNLSLIGIIFYNSLAHIALFGRFNAYFLFFNIFCLSFIVNYLFRSKQKLFANSVLLFFLLLFGYSIYLGESGAAPYRFISF